MVIIDKMILIPSFFSLVSVFIQVAPIKMIFLIIIAIKFKSNATNANLQKQNTKLQKGV